MRVPPGYAVGRILSPGPVMLAAEATAPGDKPCVLKGVLVDRAIEALGREAAILRGLERAKVPNAPRVLGDGGRWIAISRIDEPTLAAAGATFRARPELWPGAARAAFEALAAIHDAKDEVGRLDVIHGDLSPDNVYVAEDGSRATIADYGLARWRGGGTARDGAARGSLLYAAPETARGERIGPRADDFALAASILFVATGTPLRRAKAQAALVAEAAETRFDASHPWAEQARAIFPPRLADALLGCLAFDARARPPRAVLDATA